MKASIIGLSILAALFLSGCSAQETSSGMLANAETPNKMVVAKGPHGSVLAQAFDAAGKPVAEAVVLVSEDGGATVGQDGPRVIKVPGPKRRQVAEIGVGTEATSVRRRPTRHAESSRRVTHWGPKEKTNVACSGKPRGAPFECSQSRTGLCICP